MLASSLVVSFFQGPARYKKIVGGRVMMSKKKELQMARRRLGKEARDRDRVRVIDVPLPRPSPSSQSD